MARWQQAHRERVCSRFASAYALKYSKPCSSVGYFGCFFRIRTWAEGAPLKFQEPKTDDRGAYVRVGARLSGGVGVLVSPSPRLIWLGGSWVPRGDDQLVALQSTSALSSIRLLRNAKSSDFASSLTISSCSQGKGDRFRINGRRMRFRREVLLKT